MATSILARSLGSLQRPAVAVLGRVAPTRLPGRRHIHAALSTTSTLTPTPPKDAPIVPQAPQPPLTPAYATTYAPLDRVDAIAPTALPPMPGMLNPLQTLEALRLFGDRRAERPSREIFVNAVGGGAYLALGGCALYVTMLGTYGCHPLLGAAVFPTGLALITLTGADLLTGNMMFSAMNFYSQPERGLGKNGGDLAYLWGVSGAGNLLGSVTVAGCCAAWVFLPGSEGAAFAATLAAKKCALPLSAKIGKAVGANALVNLAVWQSLTATCTPGKMLAVWPPIFCFVALGLEHSVANMFFLPLGKLCGADLSWTEIFVGQIAPVALGNAAGAALVVAGLQWYGLGRGGVGRR